MAYADLHEHLRMLEEAGHLRRINQTINKDTELHPLVEARLTVEGRYYETGEKLKSRRVKARDAEND